MKFIAIISCSILLLLSVINYCEAKVITLHAKAEFAPPGNDIYLHLDDEKNTVRDVAESFCKKKGFTCDSNDEKPPKVRNSLGFHYKLDKTIKEAGMKDEQWVFIKFW